MQEGVDLRRAPHRPGPGHHAAAEDPRRVRHRRLGRGARRGRGQPPAHPRHLGRRRRRRVRGRRLDEREGLPARQVRRLALGTSRIDYNGRFCMSSAAAAGNRAFGIDRGLPLPRRRHRRRRRGPPPRVERRRDHAAVRPTPGRRTRNGGLVVVDPRRSATARLTDDGAGVHLQPAPGTDLILLLGLANVVFAEHLADTRTSTPGPPARTLSVGASPAGGRNGCRNTRESPPASSAMSRAGSLGPNGR